MSQNKLPPATAVRINEPNDSTPTHSAGDLDRILTKKDLIFLGVGATIGAGIFVLTGVVAKNVAGPAVIVSFGIAACACVIDAFCYAELATRYPVSGSAYLYASRIYGPLAGFLVGTNMIIEYAFGAAAVSQGLVEYLLHFVEFCGADVPTWVEGYFIEGTIFEISFIATCIILAIVSILARGIKESSVFNMIVTGASMLVIFVVICAGSAEIDSRNWEPFLPYGATGMFSGAAVIFFSYIGFDAVSNAAEECVNPKRDMPVGIIGSLAICAGLYMGVALVITGMVPYDEMNPKAPIAQAFEDKDMKWVVVTIYIGAIAGLITTLLGGLYSQPRIYLAMARDSLLPAFFGRTHPVYRTPFNSQITCGVLGGVIGMFFKVETLSSFLGIGLLVAYSLVCSSVVTIRSKDKYRANHLMFLLALCTLIAGFGIRMHQPVISYVFVVFIAMTIFAIWYTNEWLPLPQGGQTFNVPWNPVFPLCGVVLNTALMTTMHYLAWIRLIAFSALVSCGYLYLHWKGILEKSPAQEFAGTTLDVSLSEPLIHRSPLTNNRKS
eukprot:GFYU01004984.1.p1 GENE.GFYU01004984.1~~GFYU01004984.1.p1  ORF type:complete len:552 (-),score=121.45 GFYU01004984.1:143-1798(-)